MGALGDTWYSRRVALARQGTGSNFLFSIAMTERAIPPTPREGRYTSSPLQFEPRPRYTRPGGSGKQTWVNSTEK